MSSLLNYCPKCGKEDLVWNQINKWSCANCGFTLYHNCAAAVAVIIKHHNQIFFTVRNQDPAKGKLDLPGGFVDPNETAEETCKRELQEELQLNINLNLLKILGTQNNVYHYKEIDYNTLDVFFLYEVEDKFTVKLEQKEISETQWVNISDLNLDLLAFDSQKRFLKQYLKKLT